MREQLIQYVSLLFAGAKDCEDIKQEILQNTLDRYDDLVAGGKTPEAAYQLAIAGIGDVSELLGNTAKAPSNPPETGKPVKKRRNVLLIVLVVAAVLLVLAVLVAVVSFSVYHGNQEVVYHSVQVLTEDEATIVPENGSPQATAKVEERTNIFSTPNTNSQVIASLDAGTPVQITRQEAIDGETWAYVVEPECGWLPASTLNAMESASQETTELEIEWVSGTITIEPGDVAVIQATESSAGTIQSPMVCRQEKGKIIIDYCEEARLKFQKDAKKDLTILVPRDMELASLEIEGASVNLTVRDLAIGSAEVDTASGEISFVNCQIEDLECDSASADIYAGLSSVPREISVDAVSGDLELVLPEDAGFTLKLDTLTRKFSSDFETRLERERYVCGDGACSIELEGLSGKVRISKG